MNSYMNSNLALCDWVEELHDLIVEQLNDMFNDSQDDIKSEYMQRSAQVNQARLYSLMVDYGYDFETALEITENEY